MKGRDDQDRVEVLGRTPQLFEGRPVLLVAFLAIDWAPWISLRLCDTTLFAGLLVLSTGRAKVENQGRVKEIVGPLP